MLLRAQLNTYRRHRTIDNGVFRLKADWSIGWWGMTRRYQRSGWHRWRAKNLGRRCTHRHRAGRRSPHTFRSTRWHGYGAARNLGLELGDKLLTLSLPKLFSPLLFLRLNYSLVLAYNIRLGQRRYSSMWWCLQGNIRENTVVVCPHAKDNTASLQRRHLAG